MPVVGQWGPEEFLDRRGRPVPTVTVYVYETDGTTLASLYTSQTGATALANPLPVGVATTAAGVDVRGNGSFYAEPGPYVLAVSYGGVEVYRASITVSTDDDSGGGGGGGAVNSVTAGNATITIAGTAADPTVAVTPGTFDTAGAAAAAQAAAIAASDPAGTAAAAVAAHTGDPTAAHAASAIAFTPNGSIAATDVQAAIQEVRDEAGGGSSFPLTADVSAAGWDIQNLGEITFDGTPDATFDVNADADKWWIPLRNQAGTVVGGLGHSDFAGDAVFFWHGDSNTPVDVDGPLVALFATSGDAMIQGAGQTCYLDLRGGASTILRGETGLELSVHVPGSGIWLFNGNGPGIDGTAAPSTLVAALDVLVNFGVLASHTVPEPPPSNVDYLVGTASGALSAEIVVGTTPGGELGGTWASPTVDATHSGSSHAGIQAAAEATAAADATAKANAAQAAAIAASGPATADYLVGTAQAGLSAEIVVGTSPGGELGGTWASPTVDATHSGSSHAGIQAAAEATAQAYADGKVSDTAYDATTWNGVTTIAPSKNAVRDKFEALDVIAAGVRTAPNTGTPGQIGIDVTLSGGITGGDTLTGGTASGEDLTLASTAHATRGTIFLRDQMELLSEDKSWAGTTTYIGAIIDATLTFSDATAFNPGNAFTGFHAGPTLVLEENGSALTSTQMFAASATLLNASTEVRTKTALYAFTATPIIRGQGAGGSMTVTTVSSYRDYVIVGRVGGAGPTATVTTVSTITSDLVVEAGGTVTTRKGLMFNDATNSGTLTNQVGVDIAYLNDAATANIGIRNASTEVCTPLANTNITATSATIRHDAATVTLTANASYTLASTPTISDGQNGERLRIINVDTTDTITLQDEGTLAGSNLELISTTVALAPGGGTIELEFNSTVGAWVQTAVAAGGQVRAGGSAAGTPALSFQTDTDTGLHLAGGNTLQMVTGGTNRAQIDSDGIAIPSPGHLWLAAGVNIIPNATTGTKIGTATTQKIGFYNATPIVQGASIADATGGATVDAEARTAVNAVISRLEALGLIATV